MALLDFFQLKEDPKFYCIQQGEFICTVIQNLWKCDNVFIYITFWYDDKATIKKEIPSRNKVRYN